VGIVTLQMASGSLAAVTGSHVSPKTEELAALRAIRAALETSEGDEAWQPAPR
jgi:hypothetical protein